MDELYLLAVDVDFLFICSLLSCFSRRHPKNLGLAAGVGDNFN